MSDPDNAIEQLKQALASDSVARQELISAAVPVLSRNRANLSWRGHQLMATSDPIDGRLAFYAGDRQLFVFETLLPELRKEIPGRPAPQQPPPPAAPPSEPNGEQLRQARDRREQSAGGAPQAEVITPTRFADVQSAVAAVGNRDAAATRTALEVLSRCDVDRFEADDVLLGIKKASGYSMRDLRIQLAELQHGKRPIDRINETEAVLPWRDKMLCTDEAERRPSGDMVNVCFVLRLDPRFQFDGRPILGFNEHSGMPTWFAAPPWDRSTGTGAYTKPQPVAEADLLGLMEFVQSHGVPARKEAAFQAVMRVAAERPFNPPRDFLDDAADRWDGQPRLHLLLSWYYGCEHTELNSVIGARFAIGAVARIYDPGCKMDTALVIEGEQGIGKSTGLKELFGADHFTDEISDFGSKDAALQMQGVWAIELAELDAMGKAEISRIKRFLSQTRDRFRPPYERALTDNPRGCVFCGSTNDNEYLRDPTGGRRFWCAKSKLIRIDQIKRDRVQLWGEAVHLYRQKQKWWIDEPHLLDEAAWQVSQRTFSDAWLDNIRELLNGTTRGYVTFKEIWEHLSIPVIDRDTVRQRRISNCLRHLGWEQEGQIRDGNDRPKTFRPKPREREPGEDG